MSAVPGYISVDLTQLSRENDWQFPRQKVYNAIDGRKRFPAHFIGDMPTWGLVYSQAGLVPERRGPSQAQDFGSCRLCRINSREAGLNWRIHSILHRMLFP